MKTQKLLVVVALVCLMAFLNVSTFAQTAQAQPEPDPMRPMVRFVAQVLRAEGFDVVRDGHELIIEEQIVLELPFTLEDLEDSGIRARLVRGQRKEMNGEQLAKFRELRRCLRASNFVNNVKYTFCELNVKDAGDLLCKIGVLFDWVFDDLHCIFAYFEE